MDGNASYAAEQAERHSGGTKVGHVPADEAALEQEIKDKGLNAPRLTPEHINRQIVGEDFHVFPGTTLTVCCLKLRNGFTVTGESAAASPENFDLDIGRKIAREHARNKIWAFEGYLLRERLDAQKRGFGPVMPPKLPGKQVA